MKEHGQESSESARGPDGITTSLDMSNIWRPWQDAPLSAKSKPDKANAQRSSRYEPYRSDFAQFTGRARQHPAQQVISSFKHPVRLYWTKAAYDYMYESGEALLRNFPVQATIQIVDDYDSSDDEDDDDEGSGRNEGESENDKSENN